MAQEILTYHPPKKEPSFINMYTFIGAIAAASSPVGAVFGAIIGGMIGYDIEKHEQEYGIKAKKPNGSILNASAVIGALLFGLAASVFVPTASVVVATAIVGASAVAGGLLMGWSSNKQNAVIYDLAQKQENERQAAIGAGKSVAQYKNIPDLPAIPQQTQDTSQGQFAQQVKSAGQSAGTGIN